MGGAHIIVGDHADLVVHPLLQLRKDVGVHVNSVLKAHRGPVCLLHGCQAIILSFCAPHAVVNLVATGDAIPLLAGYGLKHSSDNATLLCCLWVISS